MRVVIIEDEPLMSNALKEELLGLDSSISIIAQLPSISESIAFIKKNGFPDLFFADIELSDGLSFEIFKETQNKTPIIFCTAYNNYALEAFHVYGIDYILKPFDTINIENALNKFKSLKKSLQDPTIDFSMIEDILRNRETNNKSSILVHKGDKITPISSDKIALVQLENGIVYVYTFDNIKFVVNYNLDKVSILLGNKFYRVNRQFIIHRDNIKDVAQYFSRKLLIHPILDFQEKLIISKANSSDFLRWLENH